MKQFVQCTLKQWKTNVVEVAWVDASKATREGLVVSLKGQDGWWNIEQRGTKLITEKQLEALQANARKGFASTEA